MSVSQNINIAYSLNQPLSPIFPSPIVSTRDPRTTDKAQIGTIWVNKSSNDGWVLTSVVSNSATWIGIGGGSGTFSSLLVEGDADIGTDAGADITIGNDQGATAVTINSGTAPISLASFSGNITLSGDDIEIGATGDMDFYGVAGSNFTLGAPTTTGTITIGGTAQTGTITLGSSSGSNTLVIAGGAGATTVQIANAQVAGSVSVGAGMTTGTISIGGTGLQTGTITIGGGTGAQTVNLATGGTGAKTVNIATGAAANVTTIGTTTAASSVTINTPTGTPVVAANGLTATVGDITATNGNVVLSTAATYVQLPGPIKIMSGAGVPSNGLAAAAGDLYIRTDPTGATERIYVATGAGAWTNVTCAA